MIEVKIKLKTNNKEKIPKIMEEIAEKIVSGIDMSNAEDYYFQIMNEPPNA